LAKSSVPRFDYHFEYHDEAWDLQVSRDLSIDPLDPDQDFADHPALRAFYAMLHRKAERERENVEELFDDWMAAERESVRKASPVRPKRTEGSIRDEIRDLKAFADYAAVLADAKFDERNLRDFVAAFDARRDMLMKVGKRLAEAEAGAVPPRTRDRRYGR
jgi:hypothetical protein